MKLLVLDAAQAELEDAQAYYLEHATSGIATAFVADYEHGARRILQYPRVGKPLSSRLRALPMRHFPYSIIYEATTDAISIHAVAHHRRRPGYWSGQR